MNVLSTDSGAPRRGLSAQDVDRSVHVLDGHACPLCDIRGRVQPDVGDGCDPSAREHGLLGDGEQR